MFAWLLWGCPAPTPSPAECTAPATLFGRPTEATGLGPDQCAPRCGCGDDVFAPPDPPADADALRAWALLEPFAPLDGDPYAEAAPAPPDADAVCAVVVEGAGYVLRDFASEGAAEDAGAVPTHYGRCGVCSTLADLAVYVDTPDLTAPVRDCGLEHLAGPPEAHLACLEALGFTEPCAQIWYYDTVHTRQACGEVCFANLDAPYQLPTGELNPCLQCDEDVSGPVFTAVAGRTRRNTGLPSALCRPCDEVHPLAHDYGAR